MLVAEKKSVDVLVIRENPLLWRVIITVFIALSLGTLLTGGNARLLQVVLLAAWTFLLLFLDSVTCIIDRRAGTVTFERRSLLRTRSQRCDLDQVCAVGLRRKPLGWTYLYLYIPPDAGVPLNANPVFSGAPAAAEEIRAFLSLPPVEQV